MRELLWQSALALLFFTVLTGVAYPLLVTGLAHALYPLQAQGSLVRREGKIVGSALIGQNFSAERYFWSRPSATSLFPYNAAASSGSNLGANNPAFLDQLKARSSQLKQGNAGATIPVDLLTASGSGLDPQITPAAAYYQVARVAKARGIEEKTVRGLIFQQLENRQFAILGESRVNVLLLNLRLDDFAAAPKTK